jgi:CRP/FNR family transcriptional regulator, cyclic AMP receptor protein
LAALRGFAAARKRTRDAVKLAHAKALFERAADRCEFAQFDSVALCAVRDAVLSFLTRTEFEAFAKNHHELCQSLLRLLTRRMRERDKMLATTSFLKVTGRIAQTLLELAEHFGQEVEPGRIVIRQQISHYDLAAMAGTAREYVARTLGNWQRRKLVSRRPSGC